MAQQIFTQRPKNAQEFLKQLEDLAKLNRQSQLKTGYETSSNTPYVLPGSQRVGTALEGTRNGQLTMPEVAGYTPEKSLNTLSAEDFFGYFGQENNSTDPNPIGNTVDGGIYYDDGVTRYPDGTFRVGDPNSQPIASNVDGSTRYQDGSSRQKNYALASMEGNKLKMKDGSIVSQNFVNQNFGTGLEAISKGLFGRVQKVTQPYGNINPIEPTPGNVNLGTDFRTRDLADKSIYFPDQAEVVEILEDDGTRFGDQSGHKGYGNSVLLKLASGEMLRVSHMENLGNIQVGQTIEPGTFIGKAGQTGNTYGEHADVEYYNENGTIDKPENFKGFSQKPQDNQQPNVSNNSQSVAPVQGQVLGLNTDPIPVQQTASTMAPDQQKQQLTSAFQAKPFANIDKPVTTSQQPSILEEVATAGNFKERGISERAQANNTSFIRQALGDFADVASTPFKKYGVPDLQISEAIAGGPTVNSGVDFAPQAAADDGEDEPDYQEAQGFLDLLSNIGSKLTGSVSTKLSSSELPQAGEGLKGLQSPVSANIFQKPAVSSMALSSRVGEASAPASLDLTESPVSGQSAQINQAVKSPANPAQSPTPSAQIFSSAKSTPQASYGSSSSNQNVSRPNSQPTQSYPKQTNTSLNYTPAKPYTPAKVSTPATKAINYTPANFSPVQQAPVSQASAQIKPQSAPSSNIFSKAINAIKTIFKR